MLNYNRITLLLTICLSGMLVPLKAATVSNRTIGETPLVIPEVQTMELGVNEIVLPDVFTINSPKGLVNTESLELELRKRGMTLTEAENAFLQLKIQADIIPENSEGYSLEINSSGINIMANQQAGLFYGIQTLAGLLRNSNKLRECSIQDYPALKMRGVYLNIRGLQTNQIPAFKKVMAFLAELKFNTLILEFADNFPYEDIDFKRNSRLSKNDVLELKKYAEELHMEIIPKIQCLSHVLWMSGYANFDGILEASGNKSWNAAWCPSNPETEELIAKIIADTAKLLRPRYFHLGVDEVNYGPFQECERCIKVSPEELFAQQILRLETEAKRNHVIPIFYHDTFLPQSLSGDITNKAKGERIIDRLSPNTTIQVWDYAGEPRVERTKFFSDRKLTVIGASYCESMRNVQTLSQLMAKTPDALGCILTYWHYVHGTLVAPQADSKLANAATVLAANYSWKPNAVTMEKIQFDPVYEYARRFSQVPESFRNEEKTVSAVNLAQHVNFLFGQEDAFPLFSSSELNELAKELAALPEQFELLKKENGRYYGILLSGRENDGLNFSSQEIPLHGKTERLAFLMTASRPMNMDLFARWDQVKFQPRIGKLVINYKDGNIAEVPLRYNGNIIDWNAAWGSYGGRIVNRGKDKRNALYQLTVLDWINPKPNKEIKSVLFSTNKTEGIMPVILAISSTNEVANAKRHEMPTQTCRESIPNLSSEQGDTVNIVSMSGRKLTPKPEISGFGYDGKTIITESSNSGPNGGPAITITIPPLAKGADSGRVNLDYAIPENAGFKTVSIQYRYQTPQHIKQSGVYLGNAEYSKCISKFRIFDTKDQKWLQLKIPVSSMHKESTGIDIREVRKLRIALWLNNRTKSVIQLGEIIATNQDTAVQHSLRTSLID